MRRTAARGGKLVIPSFALECAQEIVYALGPLRARGAVPRLPVYVAAHVATHLWHVAPPAAPILRDVARSRRRVRALASARFVNGLAI